MVFYKTTIKIEIISNGKYSAGSLKEIHYDITDGECSGHWKITKSTQLTIEQCAKELEKQASDPSFLLGEDEK